VWKELLPWLKHPFHNKAVRDRVVAAAHSQIKSAKSSSEFPDPQGPPPSDIPKWKCCLSMRISRATDMTTTLNS
jgi:hypothetical protein